MTISKEARLATIHQEALTEFGKVQVAQRDERLQCLQDRRFYSIAGAQWEGPLGEQFENKPRYEFNDIHLAVIRIFNEYRNNRITVAFQPKDGMPADDFATTVAGLYRADEKRCTAEEAYDNSLEEAVGGGFGAWRLRAVYENEEDEDVDDEDRPQTVAIEPIFDADSCVWFDLGARRQDKADAKKCWVLTPYTHEAYKEEFGDDPASWPRAVHQNEFDWCTPSFVWVAEYYRIEEKTEVLRYFRGIDGDSEDMKVAQSEIDDDPDLLEELKATGFREVRQRKVKRRRVHKYLMSGSKILEDCGLIAGRCIPIIPVYGKRWVVDGIERCMGHVRLAKDAMRLKNTLLSWLAEMSMRFDIEKPILTPEQIAGHAVMWANDNISKYPYLLANAMTDQAGNPLPPNQIQYTKAPNIPPAMAALAQIAQQALVDLLGNQQAGEEMKPNVSGKAVELIQQRLDMQVFIYMSNLAKAMKRCGEVWLSMKKELTVEDSRRMKTVALDGKAGSSVVNQPVMNDDGEQDTRFDMARADLEVDVDVGPSSTSRRAATVRAVTGMVQLTQDPQTQQVLTAFAMMNMEGEGIEDIRGFFRKQLLAMGAVKPTEEEAKEMEAAKAQQGQQQPDPQSQYLMAAAEESSAQAAQARAKTVETIASARLKDAQATQVQAETGHTHVQSAVDLHDGAIRGAQAFGGLPPRN
jgi:hypothetical protein